MHRDAWIIRPPTDGVDFGIEGVGEQKKSVCLNHTLWEITLPNVSVGNGGLDVDSGDLAAGASAWRAAAEAAATGTRRPCSPWRVLVLSGRGTLM